MIDVHLIGYTADLRHIVLDLEPGQSRGRYRLEIDLDLFLTLDEVRERRRAAGMEAGPHDRVGGEVEEAAAAGVEVSDSAERDSVGDDRAESVDHGAPSRPAPEVEPADGGRGGYRPEQRAPRTDTVTPSADDRSLLGGEYLQAPLVQEPTELPAARAPSELEGTPPVGASTPTPQPESRLSPAEIQALLRAGRSLRTVAKLAGIDVQRVERWLPPILAERTQVIQEALATPLGSAPGNSRQPLVTALTRNLSARGTDLDHISWTANRRADGCWTLQLRYRDEDRVRCASWSFDRRDRTLTAGSALAQELGWSDDPSDHEEDEPPPARPDGADVLVEAPLAEGAAPAPGPPVPASDPSRATQDGGTTLWSPNEQQEPPGREQGWEAERGPGWDPVP